MNSKEILFSFHYNLCVCVCVCARAKTNFLGTSRVSFPSHWIRVSFHILVLIVNRLVTFYVN